MAASGGCVDTNEREDSARAVSAGAPVLSREPGRPRHLPDPGGDRDPHLGRCAAVDLPGVLTADDRLRPMGLVRPVAPAAIDNRRRAAGACRPSPAGVVNST